jgi:dephospho-CoA kinase
MIGLAGLPGAGKDTVAALLTELFGVPLFRLSVSDLLVEKKCKPKGLEPTSERLLALGEATPASWFHEEARTLLATRTEAGVVLPSLRRAADQAFVRSFPYNVTIGLIADLHLRFERARLRNERPGDQQLSFETFAKRHDMPTEREVPALVQGADIILENNGSLKDLEAALWGHRNHLRMLLELAVLFH